MRTVTNLPTYETWDKFASAQWTERAEDAKVINQEVKLPKAVYFKSLREISNVTLKAFALSCAVLSISDVAANYYSQDLMSWDSYRIVRKSAEDLISNILENAPSISSTYIGPISIFFAALAGTCWVTAKLLQPNALDDVKAKEIYINSLLKRFADSVVRRDSHQVLDFLKIIQTEHVLDPGTLSKLKLTGTIIENIRNNKAKKYVAAVEALYNYEASKTSNNKSVHLINAQNLATIAKFNIENPSFKQRDENNLDDNKQRLQLMEEMLKKQMELSDKVRKMESFVNTSQRKKRMSSERAESPQKNSSLEKSRLSGSVSSSKISLPENEDLYYDDPEQDEV
jgi:hypothetical protein